MIYLDNAATTLHKPPAVGQAMLRALSDAGNPGRGAHEPTLQAGRLVLAAREAVARLLDAPDPACIAFACNATAALNTALCGLLEPGDHVITTVCEHNSVLRPLYRLEQQGVQLSFVQTDAKARGPELRTLGSFRLSFVQTDAKARLRYEQFAQLLKPNTRAVVVTGASNVTGNLTDLGFVSGFARQHGLLLILDAAQLAGVQPFSVQKLGVDVCCFTGHKALLGPQGTGGLYVRPGLRVRPLAVGGSGVHSFDPAHPSQMPTALEAGTLNVPGLAGLAAGVEWLLEQGVEQTARREMALARLFYDQLRDVPGLEFYGDLDADLRAPIVSLNLTGEDSARVADALWEDHRICVRAGAHCAPLMHKALGTVQQGVVRFSFSCQNTRQEVLAAAQAVKTLAAE